MQLRLPMPAAQAGAPRHAAGCRSGSPGMPAVAAPSMGLPGVRGRGCAIDGRIDAFDRGRVDAFDRGCAFDAVAGIDRSINAIDAVAGIDRSIDRSIDAIDAVALDRDMDRDRCLDRDAIDRGCWDRDALDRDMDSGPLLGPRRHRRRDRALDRDAFDRDRAM